MSSIKVSELPAASQPFNGSEYVLGTQNGNSVKIPASTGGITPYATVGDIPTPYTGVAKVGHSLYTGNGDVPLEIPSLNSNNELVANIVPRTDTLANLLTIIGSQGELASATDQPAIVKFNGTTAGGDTFYANSGTSFKKTSQSIFDVNVNGSVFELNNAAFLPCPSFDSSIIPIVGFVDTTNVPDFIPYLSYDGVNYFKADVAPTSSLYALGNAGGSTIVAFSMATNSVYTANHNSTTKGYTGWTTLGGSMSYPAISYPVPTGYDSVGVLCSNGSNNSVAILTYPSTITNINLSFVPGYLVFGKKHTSPSFPGPIAVVHNVSNTTFTIIYKGNSGITSTTISLSLVFSQPDIIIKDNAILISQTLTSTAHIIPIINHGTYVSIGSTISKVLPTTPILVTQTPDMFVISDAANVYGSMDGIVWQSISASIGGLISNIVGVQDGVFLKGSTGTFFISSLTDKTELVSSWSDGYESENSGTNSYLVSNNMLISSKTNKTYKFNGGGVEVPKLVKQHSVVTGNTVNMYLFQTQANIISTGTITALRVNLPPNCHDGYTVSIVLNNNITTLTIGTQVWPSGQLVMSGATYAIASATINTVYRFVYVAASSNWIRM